MWLVCLYWTSDLSSLSVPSTCSDWIVYGKMVNRYWFQKSHLVTKGNHRSLHAPESWNSLPEGSWGYLKAIPADSSPVYHRIDAHSHLLTIYSCQCTYPEHLWSVGENCSTHRKSTRRTNKLKCKNHPSKQAITSHFFVSRISLIFFGFSRHAGKTNFLSP